LSDREMSDLGPRYVAAPAAKDTDHLIALFASEVDFRAMTPGRFWEADSPERIVHEVFYQWFEPNDVITGIDYVEAGRVADRQRVDYRFHVRNDDGPFLVEQRAYFDLDDAGLICHMRVICSGYQPADEPDSSAEGGL
jgi:hypothetical protein